MSSGRATWQLWYVALSRVTKLKNLYIVGKFKPPNPPKDTDPVQVELNELKTNKLLDICFNTLQQPTGKIIAYHNVRSFFKYLEHIQNDTWYSKCDVLILAETQTIATDRPTLVGFNLIDRFDDFRKRGPRGVLVFAKSEINMKKMKVSIEKSDDHNKSFNSTLVSYDCKDFHLISGYRSPSTPTPIFDHQLTDILNEIKTGKNIILMGDFNFDANDVKNTLKNAMLKNKMRSRLEPNDFTTKENTQIDVVYTKSDYVICGTYESYFSDHKPIFCMLSNTKPKDKPKPIILKNLAIKLDRLKPNELQPKTDVRKLAEPQQKPGPAQQPGPNQIQARPLEAIVLSGEQINVADSKLTRVASNARDLRRVCRQIRTPQFYLEDTHIDAFITLANRNSVYNMRSVLSAQQIAHYERNAANAQLDDVQILFEGLAGPNRLGHFVCIHYRAVERTVYLYDSLYWRKISKRSREILDTRFHENVRVEFVHPRTRQPDGISCGIFAIAYATAIILGRDPAAYPLFLGNDPYTDPTLLLRDHLAQMLQDDRLTLFPAALPGTYYLI